MIHLHRRRRTAYTAHTWKWLEDPYVSHSWSKNIDELSGHDVPAPNPKFGIEPPIKSTK